VAAARERIRAPPRGRFWEAGKPVRSAPAGHAPETSIEATAGTSRRRNGALANNDRGLSVFIAGSRVGEQRRREG
jgi:hypothetical protein